MTSGLPAGLDRMVVVVPTYNEAENLAWVTERLLRAVSESDLLVVDGNPLADLACLWGHGGQGERIPLVMKAGLICHDRLGR